MKTMILLAFSAAWLLAQYSGHAGSTNLNVAPKPEAAERKVTDAGRPAKRVYPVIGHLEKQGRTITIKAGPKGSLYTITTKEGKVLAADLSIEDIRAKAPELHDFLKTAIAEKGPVKDASLDRPAPPQNLRINVR